MRVTLSAWQGAKVGGAAARSIQLKKRPCALRSGRAIDLAPPVFTLAGWLGSGARRRAWPW